MRLFPALILSFALILAGGLASWLWMRTPAGDLPPGADPRALLLDAELSALQEGAAGLEESVRALEARISRLESAANAREAEAPPAVPDDEIARRIESALDERLEKLEAEITDHLTAIERRASAPAVIGQQVETEEERAAIVAEKQAIAVDRTLSAESRIRALADLRFRDGRSLEVTRAMIEMIMDPAIEASRRAHIIRNLDGVTFPELKPSLIQSVLNDPDPEVREEAAETLGEYLRENDQEVGEVLRRVNQTDSANRVREEAANQLRGWGEEEAAQ